MATKYPNQIDSATELPVQIDGVSPVRAQSINELRDALIAVQTEMGIEPSGTFADVRERIDFLESLLAGGGGIGNTAADIVLADSGANYISTDVEGALAEVGASLAAIPPPIAVNVSLADTDGYYTATNVEDALAELGPWLIVSASTAEEISIVDADGYFASTNVEGALAELGKYGDRLLSTHVVEPTDGYLNIAINLPYDIEILQWTVISNSGTASAYLAVSGIRNNSSLLSVSSTEATKDVSIIVSTGQDLDIELVGPSLLSDFRSTLLYRPRQL